MSITSTKNETISIAKGIAIILMVICHSGCPKWAWDFIYMFHMPLFFFVSGYCFKDKYIDDYKSFIKRRFSGLYFPYVKYTLLFLLLHNLFYYLNIYNDTYGKVPAYSLSDIPLRLIRIFFTMVSGEQLLGGFWFLRALLIGSIISVFLLRLTKNKAIVATCIMLIFGLLTKAYSSRIPLLDFVSLSFLSSFFFLVGVEVKRINKTPNNYVFIIMIVALPLLTYFFHTTMQDYNCINMIPYAVGAICGIMLVLKISQYIFDSLPKIQRLFIFVGDHTMSILAWHMLSFKLVSLFLILLLGYDIKRLGCFPVIPDNIDSNFYYCSYWYIYSLVGVFIPLSYAVYKHYYYSKK